MNGRSTALVVTVPLTTYGKVKCLITLWFMAITGIWEMVWGYSHLSRSLYPGDNLNLRYSVELKIEVKKDEEPNPSDYF